MKSLNILKYSLLSLLLGVVSCSEKDEPTAPDQNEAVTVSFSVQAGDPASRADARLVENIDKMVCAVYDVNGNLLNQLGEDENGQITVTEKNANGNFEVSFTLVRGQEYKVAFWAQNSECDAYTTTDLKAVTVSYDGAECNNDIRDAFCAVEVFTVSSLESGVRSVTLRRPFASVNVVMDREEFESVFGDDQDMQSGLVLGPVATVLDVVNNNVDETQLSDEVSFSPNPIPEGYVTVRVQKDGVDTEIECKYIASCYILVGDENEGTSTYSSYLTDLSVMLDCDTFGSITVDMLGDDDRIPVQRNWNTNIALRSEQLEDFPMN